MKRTYIGGIVFAICFITASAIVMTPSVRTKNVPCEDFVVEDDKIFTEEAGWSKNPKISQMTAIDDDSAMPCCDPERFREWYESYSASAEGDGNEQETEEEIEIQKQDLGAVYEVSHPETEAGQEVDDSGHKIFTVNGEMLNPGIQAYLYQRLADHHIEWFMPYAVMVAYQESHFDCTAVNQSNGIDCGLFQFRAPYYTGTDIFNPYEQIDIFTEQMANRANAGLDVYEMISRHNVSDYGTYNNEYVMQVMKHEANLREVSNEERNDQD